MGFRNPNWVSASQGEARRVGRLLVVYGLLGVVAGGCAVGVNTLVHWATSILLHLIGDAPIGVSWPTQGRWLLLFFPMLGGLLTGGLLSRFCPEAMGSGVGQVAETYLQHHGEMRHRVPFWKTIGSILTMGSGGSGGIEGPVGQVAAGIGSIFGRIFHLSQNERRILLMAGFAAGIGAVFGAPMAAAIFAAEVLYREMDIEHEVLVPGIIAATVAHGVFGALVGPSQFRVGIVKFHGAVELLPYSALALVLAIAAFAFIKFYRWVVTRVGRSARTPVWLRPAVGGLGVGLIGLFVPHALGPGYGIVQLILAGGVGLVTLITIAVAKAMTTAMTVGTGGSGGLFAPSLVIGGLLGAAVASAVSQLVPELALSPTAFIIVGMAGFFSAVINAPLSTVIMVSELVGSYTLVVPSLWVCTLAWLLTHRISLFDQQVQSRFDAPFRLTDMMGAVLNRISVGEAIKVQNRAVVTVAPDLEMRTLVEHFAHCPQAAFPILAAGTDHLIGVVDGHQLRIALAESGIDNMLIANDFQSVPATICLQATLFDAMAILGATGFDELVVVGDDDPYQFVGMISRREIITAYHRRMLTQSPNLEDVIDNPVEDDDLVAAIERGGILLHVSGTTPDAVVAEMIAAADLPAATDRDGLLVMLRAREALGSTGVGDGIALPHPHAADLGVIEAPHIIIGLLNTPVEWHAFDDKPVETVCILLSPSGEMHLHMLGVLARALHDSELRALFRRRVSPKQILEYLRSRSR